jgi:hypothetical protein
VREGVVRKGREFSQIYRFLGIVNTIVAIIWTLLIASPLDLSVNIQRMIAEGGPGTWFLLAYLMFITVGVLGFFILSVIYGLYEVRGVRVNRFIAWPSLILTYIGITFASLLLGVAGYIGGSHYVLFHSSPETIHQILSPYIPFIRFFVILAVIGVLAGVISVIEAELR